MKHRVHSLSSRRALVRSVLACKAPKAAIHAAAQEVASGAAKISGGATLIPIKGLWAADGSRDLDRYEGPVEIEDGVAIEITVTHDRLEELHRELPPIVAAACRRFALPADWIHTDIEIHGQRFAAHFRIGTG